MSRLTDLAGAGLYVHIPFCSAICPYCDFAVLTGGTEKRRRFVASLLAEIDLCEDFPHPFDTIYFGGGTPSLLEPEELEAILESLQAKFDVDPRVWISLESNPEDVNRRSAAEWRRLGVQTLSLGVQSFDAAELRFLGRRHDPDSARKSVEVALEAGFAIVSLDLIYGLPETTTASWQQNLETAVGLSPQHISCYQLTVSAETPFGRQRSRGKLTELSNDRQAEHFILTHELLGERGYPAYELSNFAREVEHRSRHNQKYWCHAPYLGLGPSSHSFDGTRRWWNARHLDDYQSRIEGAERPIEASETLSRADLALEAMMLGLRTVEGVDIQDFKKRFGVDLLEGNRQYIGQGIERGEMMLSANRLALTVRGLAIADGIAANIDINIED